MAVSMFDSKNGTLLLGNNTARHHPCAKVLGTKE